MEQPTDRRYRVIFRSQAWFRPSVAVEDLPPFPKEDVDTFPGGRLNDWYLKPLLGRGPVSHRLPPYPHIFSEQGQDPYPTFLPPGVAPRGGSVMVQSPARRIEVDESSALLLLEVGIVELCSADCLARYDAEIQKRAANLKPGELGQLVHPNLLESRRRLDTIIGAYAFYQYPLVWDCVGRSDSILLVDLRTKKVSSRSYFVIDNFIPFRLQAGKKVISGRLSDAIAANWGGVVQAELSLPFLLLGQSLWEKNLNVRFLMQFWILEYLAQRHAKELGEDAAVREFVEQLGKLVAERFPQHAERFRKRKGQLARPSLSEVICAYANDRDVLDNDLDERMLKRAVRVRNRLSHGADVDNDDMRMVELAVRRIARRAVRSELEAVGITLAEDS